MDVIVTFTSLPPMKNKVCAPPARSGPPRSASALANTSRWSHLRSLSSRISREHATTSALRSRSHHSACGSGSSSPSRPLSPIHDLDERASDPARARRRASPNSPGSPGGHRRAHRSHIYVCGHHDVVGVDGDGDSHGSGGGGGDDHGGTRAEGAASRLAARDKINARSQPPSSPRGNRVSIARTAAGQSHVRGSHHHQPSPNRPHATAATSDASPSMPARATRGRLAAAAAAAGTGKGSPAAAKRNPNALMGFNDRLQLVRQRQGFPRLARASHRACRAT